MPGLLLAFVFWSAVLAVVVSQVMILRSSARVLRTAAHRNVAVEWVFAVGPALALAAVLAFSWRAAMRPAPIQVDLAPVAGQVGT